MGCLAKTLTVGAVIHIVKKPVGAIVYARIHSNYDSKQLHMRSMMKKTRCLQRVKFASFGTAYSDLIFKSWKHSLLKKWRQWSFM